MKTTKLTGYALAAAAAGLFAAVATTGVLAADKAATATVKCENSSACKGKGECKTAKNDCKGHNACKGQGMTSQKDDASCKKAQGAAAKK